MQNFFKANQNKELYFRAFSRDESVKQQREKGYIEGYSQVLLQHKELLQEGISKLEDFIQFFLERMSDNNSVNVTEFIQRITITFVNVARG